MAKNNYNDLYTSILKKDGTQDERYRNRSRAPFSHYILAIVGGVGLLAVGVIVLSLIFAGYFVVIFTLLLSLVLIGWVYLFIRRVRRNKLTFGSYLYILFIRIPGFLIICYALYSLYI